MFLSDPPYRMYSCAPFLMVVLWIAAISLVADGHEVKPPFYAYYPELPTSKDQWKSNVDKYVQTFDVSNAAAPELIELEGKTEKETQRREGGLDLVMIEAFKEYIDKGRCYKFGGGENIGFFAPVWKIPENASHQVFKQLLSAEVKEHIRSEYQKHRYSMYKAQIQSEHGDDVEDIECGDLFPTVFKKVLDSIYMSDIHEKVSKRYLSVAAKIQQQYLDTSKQTQTLPDGLPEVVSLVELRMFLDDQQCLEKMCTAVCNLLNNQDKYTNYKAFKEKLCQNNDTSKKALFYKGVTIIMHDFVEFLKEHYFSNHKTWKLYSQENIADQMMTTLKNKGVLS